MSTKQKVIVVGAGIAGLASAARMAYNGFGVTVLERNSTHGGKLGSLHQDGYSFDTGPSLFTQPYIFEELFTYCGKRFSDYVSYHKLDINTHYFYEDGTKLLAYQDHSKLFDEVKAQLGIDSSALVKFLQAAEKAYSNIGSIFLDEPIHKLATWTTNRIPKALAHVKLDYLTASMHSYHKKALKHPKLVQLFDRFATYNGSNPNDAPAMLSMIAHLEMNEGAYYPKGGMRSLSKAVYQLCLDLGVTFLFNSNVEEISVTNDVVNGVVVNGKQLRSDYVITNSDVYYTYKDLLKDEQRASKIKEQERSSSAIIFYWGIKHSFQQLGLHNIFFAKDYKAEFDSIFKQHTAYEDPTVYINITSKEEANHAPKGCENWFVLINTPSSDHVQGKEWIELVKAKVIRKLNRMLQTDITAIIETEEILTPALIERNTGSYLGALYGTASNATMAAFNRHPNYSKQYKGLYFAGGTVHPGGGIPLCLRSAKLATEHILSS